MSTFNTIFKDNVCRSMGRMLDFAVHGLHRNAEEFLTLFVATGTAALIECGDIRYVAGMSGTELAYVVMDRSGIEYDRIRPRYTTGTSVEQYIGSALAAAQNETGVPFGDLLKVLDVQEAAAEFGAGKQALLNDLPWNIGEAERLAALESSGAEFEAALTLRLIEKVRHLSKDTRLKTLRMQNGLSQSQLAAESGVPLRTIQQYEQRQKNINKAQFEYLVRLSDALNCDPLQLIEPASSI